MVESLQFWINGVQIEESPDGWENYAHTIKLDRELKGLFEIVDASFTFKFDGYQMLKAAYDANGYCFNYPIEIKQLDANGHYITIYNGLLYFKDIEFTEGIEGYSAKCRITDNSFFSTIYNNRNVKARIYVGKSKSGVVIPQAPYLKATFFNATTGGYYSHITGAGYERQDTAFRVYDVLKFFVSFMSDGKVNFVSNTFGDGGIGEGAMITIGLVPRFTSGVIGTGITQELFEENFPELSFAEVLKELDKQYNLGFKAGNLGASPYIQIEEYKYLFPNTVLQDLPDIDQIKRTTASELLPASVKIGSEIVTDETFLTFPATIRFLGTNSENYQIVNGCNTDQELDLVNSWIVDTNTIEDLVMNGATTAPTTFDGTIILLNTHLTSLTSIGDAVDSDWLGTGGHYYNELYINSNKAARYLGAIPADIAAFLGDVDDTFTAESTAYDPTFPLYYNNGTDPERLIECDNELTDPSNNYDPALFFYQAPNTGVYTLYGLVKYELQNFGAGVTLDNTTTIFIRRTDSGGTPISDTPVVSNISALPNNTSQIFSYSGTANVILNANDRAYLYIKVDGDLVNYRIYPLAQYGCTGTTNGGGVYYTYDPTEMPIIRNTFATALSVANFTLLRANPLGLLSFGVKDGKKYFGWIEELKYKPYTESNFTLITNEKNNQ